MFPEPAGEMSFLKVELKLSSACSKDGELKPPTLLSSVLQALAIQGDLQHKIKLFSKKKQHRHKAAVLLCPFKMCIIPCMYFISFKIFMINV